MEPLEADNMSKFKIGDRVRLLSDATDNAKVAWVLDGVLPAR